MFFKNLIIAVLLAAVLILGAFWGLNIYTNHGKSYPIPNLRHISLDSAKAVCEANELRSSIYDSVYVNGLPGGTIIDQFPDSGFHVKKNRNVYLTINMFEAQKIAMPNLVDLPYRTAKSILKGMGFQIGRISYEPGYENLVLKQTQDSIEIPEGSIVSKGSNIDLVLGMKNMNMKTLVPYLVSLSVDSAKTITSDAYLNIGAVIYDETVLNAGDSLNALIFKQNPKADKKSTILLGSSIDIWLTKSETKIELDTIFFNLNDSLDILNEDSINLTQ